jgi:HK97 family phage major capsid protein
MAFDKKGREQLDRLATQMRDHMSKIDAQNRPWTVDERTEYQRMEEDYTNQEQMVVARERSEDRFAALRQPAANPGAAQVVIAGPEQLQEYLTEFRLTPSAVKARVEARTPKVGDSAEMIAQKLHERAFHNYLRQARQFKSIEGLTDEDRHVLSEITKIQNAQSGNVGSQGGYVIPTGFSKDLFEAMKWFGGIDGVVDEFETGSGNPWPWPTINDTTNKGRIIGQNVQVTETDLVFGQVTFNAYIGSSDIILIPLALMEDSYFDMDALAARLLGIRLGRLLNFQCTVGTGVGGPTGIVTAVAANGTVLTLANGNTASIAYNNLVDLEHSVDPAYRYNPATRWMMSDAMLKLIKKLVDGNNRPLWQPGLTASFREGAAVDLTASKPTILDHPYVINQDMATPAASAYTMVFGDMSCFKVRKVAGGVTVLRLVERYADYLQIGLQAFMRFDSNEIDAGTHPLAVMQQSAV